jgi:hypothetical protein
MSKFKEVKFKSDALEEQSNVLDTLIVGNWTISADNPHSWALKQYIAYHSTVLGPKVYLLDLGYDNLEKINAWLAKPPETNDYQSIYAFADMLEVGVYGGVNALLITLE